MKILNVELGERSYPIYIGPDLLGQAQLFVRHIAGEQVMVVTNETVAPLYLDRLVSALDGFHVETVILPDGEEYKTWEIMNRIFDAMLESRFDRSSTIVALGGGVIGDMAGFAAACYQRGVAYLQVPTTLLAQVDSSVGGKTAVNHPLGKNMIGAFYQPQCVIADTTTLSTLDNRELHAGIAEIIKYGLIRDRDFYEWLESNMESMLVRDDGVLAHAIEQSCRNKAEVVAADEREAGVRALLNLGHTFGHAIETGLGYGVWLHGEAVAAGMCMAADMSCRVGRMDRPATQRIIALIGAAGLPVTAPAQITTEQFLEMMAVDKKTRAGNIRLVLLDGIGAASLVDDYPPQVLRQTIEASYQRTV